MWSQVIVVQQWVPVRGPLDPIVQQWVSAVVPPIPLLWETQQTDRQTDIHTYIHELVHKVFVTHARAWRIPKNVQCPHNVCSACLSSYLHLVLMTCINLFLLDYNPLAYRLCYQNWYSGVRFLKDFSCGLNQRIPNKILLWPHLWTKIFSMAPLSFQSKNHNPEICKEFHLEPEGI
jgi:hypothetical protein